MAIKGMTGLECRYYLIFGIKRINLTTKINSFIQTYTCGGKLQIKANTLTNKSQIYHENVYHLLLDYTTILYIITYNN